jgi:hypothetical protein
MKIVHCGNGHVVKNPEEDLYCGTAGCSDKKVEKPDGGWPTMELFPLGHGELPELQKPTLAFDGERLHIAPEGLLPFCSVAWDAVGLVGKLTCGVQTYTLRRPTRVGFVKLSQGSP